MKKLLRDFWIAVKGGEENFTSMSVNRAIFMLSIPMVLEMLMESLFAIVDVFFVSRISIEAVATVGLTESVLTLVIAIAIGMSMAATAMVARRVGEGDREKASISAVQAIVLGVGLSLVIGVIGFIFADDVLRAMGGSEELIEQGVQYTRIMFVMNFTLLMLFLLNAIFRGAGNASIAMRTLWIANGINIVLDPCFIFGLGPFPEMGLAGAAVATNIGRGVGVLFQLYYLIRGTGIIRIARRHIQLRWRMIKRLIEVAAGGTGQFLIASASWIIIMRIMAVYGSAALAGYTIAIRIFIFTILPSWGMSNAAATLVGQNLGAKQPERAERSVWQTARYNMYFLLSVSIILIAFAPQVIAFFHNDPEVMRSGVLGLRIVCRGYAFYAYGMVMSQAFNGAGDTRTPTVINFFCFWLLQIPMAYYLGLQLDLGPGGIYAAVAISESILAFIAIWLFRKGRWKQVEI